MASRTTNTEAAKREIKIPEFVRQAGRHEEKESMLSGKWWNRFFVKLVAVMAVLVFTVSTLGVLAIPVIMAFTYSPLWVMLYGAYLLILLLFVSTGK